MNYGYYNTQTVSFIEPGKKRNKLPGISNWFEWSWPIIGEYAGYIQARDIANLWRLDELFSKKAGKIIIEKPNPNVSILSIPKNPWTVPLPNDTGFTDVNWFS